MSERRYGQWAGNPEGYPENTAKCMETKPAYKGSVRYVQCDGKRRASGLCARHERMFDRHGLKYPLDTSTQRE